jgi:hypothetical protein
MAGKNKNTEVIEVNTNDELALANLKNSDVASETATNNVNPLVDYDPVRTKETDYIKIRQQENENLIRLGVVVNGMEVKTGAQKKDKDGNLTNERYDDKYYLTLSVRGLNEFQTEVSSALYRTVAIGGTYRGVGRYGVVKEFGKEVTQPVFNQFIELIPPMCEEE